MNEHESHTEQSETTETQHLDAGYELSDINVGKIVGLGVGIVIFLIVSFFILNSFFIQSKEDLVYERVLKPGNPKLAELQKKEHQILHSYGVVDSSRGIYRIPIDRAMNMIAEESFQQRIKQAEEQ